MELFWLEHKKLWRKKIVKICVFLCFVYYVIFGSILLFQWFGFGSSDDYTSAFGNNFDGYTVIKDSQEYALSFGGRELLIIKIILRISLIDKVHSDRHTEFHHV